MTTPLSCPHCGEPLASDAPEGLCPRCLLRGGLGNATAADAGAFAAPRPDELAPLFPQLEVLELLGQGGMGAVYKARQPGLDRLVALKILPPEAGCDPAFAERFAREARALARLNHPHIVGVHDFGRAGDLYYLVMEYVDGHDLRRHIRAGGLTLAEVGRIVGQTCDALQFAHDEGVVHRDVKPENILLTHKGQVKIADFGLAKLLGRPAGQTPLTATRQVMGTPHYMAPEQEERPGAVDHRADLYALGVVFYELLTGELPLGNFAPPSGKAAVDARVDAVVLQALAREPERRYQNAAEMRAALETIGPGTPGGAPPGAAQGTSGTGRRRRRRWLVAGAACAGVLAGLLLWRQFAAPAFASKALRWGGDASGGAPYIIEQGQGQQPTGFESELAEYLAGRLGVRSEFVQKSWDHLQPDLLRGDVDVILNGYEWSPDRERVMASTIPYYLYRLQLLVRQDSPIQGWEDLRRARSGRRLRVGVLSDSAAHNYLKENFSEEDIDIFAPSEEGSTGVMGMVRDGRLDATVQDVPVVVYYVSQKHGYDDLRCAGKPIAPGYYVLYVRPKDNDLRERLNEAIRDARRDGTLKRIYDRYGLWDEDDQRELERVSANWPPATAAASGGVADYALLLARAAVTTVVLAFLSMPLAMLVGLLVAVGRLYGPRWLDWLLGAYVELLRGTPVLMQLFVIFYLLPYVGVRLDPFWAGVLGLAINYSAYEAENYRAGLLAVPRGQMEAALALGMGTPTALRRVVIPQAVRIVIPPVTNDFIALFKDTSVCSVIAVVELTGRYRGLMVNHPDYMLRLGLMTALLYLMMSYPLSLVARRLERRSPAVPV
jgi:polar amino acid transport system substrate-binding protein